MPDYTVVELTADETHPLRLAVLRDDTPSRIVTFAEDDWPGTVHLGVRDAGAIVAISTWIPRPHHDEAAVQLRGMATAVQMQGRGLGAILLAAGCERATKVASLVWARARDTALNFYVRNGFTVEGDGFIDEQTQKPHHLIVRRLASPR
jgi:GNAT superfamily N-acetyltransferase